MSDAATAQQVLGEALRHQAGVRGLSLHQLAAESGISYRTVRTALRGSHLITLTTLTRICRALGVGIQLDLGTERPLVVVDRSATS